MFRKSKRVGTPSGRLAVLVPTYRFDARARHTLAAMASMASDQLAVVIADNSESRDKHEFLETLGKIHPNVHIHCHSKNIGALGNWEFLFAQATLDYYLFVGDDDFCTPPYIESALRLLEQHSDASAAAGSFVMVTSKNQMIRGNGARTESTASGRCTNFLIGGGNSLPNSMGRRAAAQPFIDYTRDHPLRASFFDWMMSYTLLAQGTYQVEDSGLYLYDVSNWEGAEATWRSNAKFYVAAGLPESFTWFHELYWAVEFVHFFRGVYSPVSDVRERTECAQFFYLNRIREFRRLWASGDSAAALEKMISHRPSAVDAVRALLANDDALWPDLFRSFCEVLGSFDRDCAIAYLDYATGSVDRASAHGDAVALTGAGSAQL